MERVAAGGVRFAHLCVLFCLHSVGFTCFQAAAEEVALKDLVESDDQLATDKVETTSKVRSPLATALAVRAAGRQRDWQAVARYADFRFLPDKVLAQGEAELMRKLALMWERHQIMDLTSLSDEPSGRLDDDLPSYREALGELHYGDKTFVVYLQLVPDGMGGQDWKISNATVAQIPEM